MNRGPFIFLGLFVILASSWLVTLDIPRAESGQLSALGTGADRLPRTSTGLAKQGREVYQELGCVACHTQQVRFSAGNDLERGWGDRQSVARDYIDQTPAFVGSQRIGPDLTNVGSRRSDANWLHRHFYNPQIDSPNSPMPPFSFLYEEREIVGEGSDRALSLPSEYAPEAGKEIIPTRKAEALVAYIMSLKFDYDLPEAPNQDKVTLK